MAKGKILVIEDEKDIRELLSYNLSKEGYDVSAVPTGEAGLLDAIRLLPDAIILDLMLPGLDGLDVCRRLKAEAKTRDIPVLMLTAKGEETDIIIGLEFGADDYITKPFSPKVLNARIKAVIRRRQRQETDQTAVLERGDLVIDPVRHVVRVGADRLDLTATEFGVLSFLARRPGWVFTRQQIVDSVKGEDYAVTERSVDVQLVGLRKKLGTCANLIETVRGIGYRFKDAGWDDAASSGS
ncbi:MAG: response regulator [Verrucomicrobia bacterium]|nr:response regulator [Verrucomicrobiota bacterium]